MADLVEFLRARLDEEEATAQLAQHCATTPWHYFGGRKFANTAVISAENGDSIGRCGGCGEQGEYYDSPAMHIAYWDPARVLAEVAAKRAILGLCAEAIDIGSDDDGPLTSGSNLGTDVLRAFAQPYADHPGFDPSWRAEVTSG